jgi:hypothetical protein
MRYPGSAPDISHSTPARSSCGFRVFQWFTHTSRIAHHVWSRPPQPYRTNSAPHLRFPRFARQILARLVYDVRADVGAAPMLSYVGEQGFDVLAVVDNDKGFRALPHKVSRVNHGLQRRISGDLCSDTVGIVYRPDLHNTRNTRNTRDLSRCSLALTSLLVRSGRAVRVATLVMLDDEQGMLRRGTHIQEQPLRAQGVMYG